MLKRLNANIIIAFCTSCALIAFAFYERYEGPIQVRATTFYMAAAVICLLPVVYGLLRCKTCRAQIPKAGG